MADIELVIKIPEKDWGFIKESDGCRWSRAIIDGVINGTPLPKGHGRLIDADKLNEQFGEVMDTTMRKPKFTKDVEYILRTTATVRSQIKDADTIIEADKEESEEER